MENSLPEVIFLNIFSPKKFNKIPQNPQDLCSRLVSKTTRQFWIAGLISFLIFVLLLFLSHQHYLRLTWLTFALFSLTVGYWLFSFCQCATWLRFLSTHAKNQSVSLFKGLHFSPRKKAQRSLLNIALSTGANAFMFALLYLQQPDNSGSVELLSLQDIFMLVIFGFAISIVTFILANQFTISFLKISLFPKFSRRKKFPKTNNHLDSSELSPFAKSPVIEDLPIDSASKAAWEAWNQNPENPTTMLYQIKHHHLEN